MLPIRHAGKHVGVGRRLFDRRIEEGRDRIDLDVAAGEDARQEFGKIMPLGDRQRPRRRASGNARRVSELG